MISFALWVSYVAKIQRFRIIRLGLTMWKMRCVSENHSIDVVDFWKLDSWDDTGSLQAGGSIWQLTELAVQTALAFVVSMASASQGNSPEPTGAGCVRSASDNLMPPAARSAQTSLPPPWHSPQGRQLTVAHTHTQLASLQKQSKTPSVSERQGLRNLLPPARWRGDFSGD